MSVAIHQSGSSFRVGTARGDGLAAHADALIGAGLAEGRMVFAAQVQHGSWCEVLRLEPNRRRPEDSVVVIVTYSHAGARRVTDLLTVATSRLDALAPRSLLAARIPRSFSGKGAGSTAGLSHGRARSRARAGARASVRNSSCAIASGNPQHAPHIHGRRRLCITFVLTWWPRARPLG